MWYVPASIRKEHAEAGNPLPSQVPAGPDNPLGKYVLLLGMPGYLIHGTNQPYGVGMRVSHGCVRLYPENIEPLFELVAIGTPVTIVNQPYLVAWDQGELLLEAHAPLEGDGTDWQSDIEKSLGAMLASRDDVALEIDADRVVALIDEGRGFPMPVSRPGEPTEQFLLTAMVVENTVEYHAEIVPEEIDSVDATSDPEE